MIENAVLENMKKRFSCRKFKTDPVEREKLEAVIDAAKYAASGHNKQAWHFPEDFYNAPVVIMISYDPKVPWPEAGAFLAAGNKEKMLRPGYKKLHGHEVLFQIHFGADYSKGTYGWTLDLETVKRSVDRQLKDLMKRLGTSIMSVRKMNRQ